jgi:hypothetical protein
MTLDFRGVILVRNGFFEGGAWNTFFAAFSAVDKDLSRLSLHDQDFVDMYTAHGYGLMSWKQGTTANV